jgi:hypothetical protein
LSIESVPLPRSIRQTDYQALLFLIGTFTAFCVVFFCGGLLLFGATWMRSSPEEDEASQTKSKKSSEKFSPEESTEKLIEGAEHIQAALEETTGEFGTAEEIPVLDATGPEQERKKVPDATRTESPKSVESSAQPAKLPKSPTPAQKPPPVTVAAQTPVSTPAASPAGTYQVQGRVSIVNIAF